MTTLIIIHRLLPALDDEISSVSRRSNRVFSLSRLFQKYVSEGSTVRDCVPTCMEKGECDDPFPIVSPHATYTVVVKKKKKNNEQLQSIFAKLFRVFFAQYLRTLNPRGRLVNPLAPPGCPTAGRSVFRSPIDEIYSR